MRRGARAGGAEKTREYDNYNDGAACFSDHCAIVEGSKPGEARCGNPPSGIGIREGERVVVRGTFNRLRNLIANILQRGRGLAVDAVHEIEAIAGVHVEPIWLASASLPRPRALRKRCCGRSPWLTQSLASSLRTTFGCQADFQLPQSILI
jgi:hypothetical protein